MGPQGPQGPPPGVAKAFRDMHGPQEYKGILDLMALWDLKDHLDRG